MIQKSKVRSHLRERCKKEEAEQKIKKPAYRLSADVWPALDEAVKKILNRAIEYTRPQVTITGREIMMAVSKQAFVPTGRRR